MSSYIYSSVPLQYANGRYEFTVGVGDRGCKPNTPIDRNYVVIELETENDETQHIGFHTAKGFEMAMQAMLEAGLRAFGLETIQNIKVAIDDGEEKT